MVVLQGVINCLCPNHNLIQDFEISQCEKHDNKHQILFILIYLTYSSRVIKEIPRKKQQSGVKALEMCHFGRINRLCYLTEAVSPLGFYYFVNQCICQSATPGLCSSCKV